MPASASAPGSPAARFPRPRAVPFLRPRRFPPLRSETGQASVELVAALPFVGVAGLVAWQLALIGHTAWLCAGAARVAARADAVGRDPRAAARSALPSPLEHGLRVSRRRSGGVRVEVRLPVPFHLWRAPVRVGANASLGGPR